MENKEVIATVIWQWDCPFCGEQEAEVSFTGYVFHHECGACDEQYKVVT
tara:strand:+ start:337 stop:483 length:147 start_codon:yes stop_codon:yes gene_type:complete